MSVVNYLTLDGEIVSETRNGVKTDYIPDPLGSTSKLVNTSQTVTDVFEYWPYGELRLHTGGSGTPFRFGGTWGYYTHSPSTRLRVGARDLRVDIGRWQTVDPVWPGQSPYVYCDGRPVACADPSGLQTNWQQYQQGMKSYCGNLLRSLPYCSSATPGHIGRPGAPGHGWPVPVSTLKPGCFDKIVASGSGTPIPHSGPSVGRTPCKYTGSCFGRQVVVTVGYGSKGPCISNAWMT
jgi:RHS repeat-associated protein